MLLHAALMSSEIESITSEALIHGIVISYIITIVDNRSLSILQYQPLLMAFSGLDTIASHNGLCFH